MSSKDVKQVIVVRKDLKMGKGKIAIQVAHASVSAAEIAKKENIEVFQKWKAQGQAKIAVKVSSLTELLKIRDMVDHLSLPFFVVEDRGLTQVEPGTVTCLGVGPVFSSKIDRITKKLKLL